MIELLGIHGDDLLVVNAARVSFNKHTTVFTDKDYRLLKYLLKYKHWTPFGHPQLTLRIKMPIFIARQWFKSSVGVIRNEVSRRYIDSQPEFFLPEVLRERAVNKKQGSRSTACGQSSQLIELMEATHQYAASCYNNLIVSGVCPEQARAVLPQSMYTEFYETGSLAAYLRILGLRDAEDAQKEIRDYAIRLHDILSGAFPNCMRAYKELGSSEDGN